MIIGDLISVSSKMTILDSNINLSITERILSKIKLLRRKVSFVIRHRFNPSIACDEICELNHEKYFMFCSNSRTAKKKKKKRKEETLKYQYLSDSPIFILFIYSLLETYLFANTVENMFNDK